MATLSLSESFYSVQCEGATTGYPAYFIRLKGCNLMCGGKGGSLVEEGKATWWCDSEAVWRQGKKTDIQILIDDWKREGILDWVLEGRVHLVWTGGEPTLKRHQKDIVSCVNHLFYEEYDGCELYNEIETNGTQYIEDELFSELNQINCSVKLANSGISYINRCQAVPLKRNCIERTNLK